MGLKTLQYTFSFSFPHSEEDAKWLAWPAPHSDPHPPVVNCFSFRGRFLQCSRGHLSVWHITDDRLSSDAQWGLELQINLFHYFHNFSSNKVSVKYCQACLSLPLTGQQFVIYKIETNVCTFYRQSVLLERYSFCKHTSVICGYSLCPSLIALVFGVCQIWPDKGRKYLKKIWIALFKELTKHS